MDSYGLLAILTLALGLALLVAEVFIPSGGVISVAAAITFVVSIWSAWQAWFKTDQMSAFIAYCLVLMVMLPSVLIGAFYALPRTAYGQRLINPPSREEMEPFVAETERLSRFIGKTGTTVTKLVPSGIVQIDNERFHAESEGMLVSSNTTVKVLSLKGNGFLVREVRDADVAAAPAHPSEASEPERTPLDDEYAQS